MNTKHRIVRPLQHAVAEAPVRVGRVGAVQARAGLEGLDVSDPGLAAWLAAGGERRSSPRLIDERNGIVFSLKR